MDSNNGKPDIRELTLNEIKESLTGIGERSFRAKQVYEWIWKKSVTDFQDMTNLSRLLRESLDEHYCFRPVKIDFVQKSEDDTIKLTFRLFDGNLIEGVLIPSENRMTACISSQVGCSLSCKFCATGYLERKRNLAAAEIYDQVTHISRISENSFNRPLSNIVFMGMGEPLLNYNNVLQSIRHLTSPDGLGISAKRITLSTAGIAKMIRKLADDEAKFRLALSLHAANDIKRNQIMPINETNSLDKLAEALQYFYYKTKSRITFEYIALHQFNDSLEDAAELFQFTKKVPCKVNIIEYNPIDQADFHKSDEDKLEKFRNYLEKRNVNVKLRRSRGKDIDAACGQLANKRK
jgi:23S rRNA (adenine2503-C2)-methyltransferase